MQSSPWNDERITAYVLGELPAEQVAQLEAAMKSNSEVAHAVDEVRGITAQLSEMYAAEPAMTLDAAKRDQILDSRGAVVTPMPLTAESGRWTMAKPLLALAASVLLLGTLAMWLYAERKSVQIAMSDRAPSPAEPSELAVSADPDQSDAKAIASPAADAAPPADAPASARGAAAPAETAPPAPASPSPAPTMLAPTSLATSPPADYLSASVGEAAQGLQGDAAKASNPTEYQFRQPQVRLEQADRESAEMHFGGSMESKSSTEKASEGTSLRRRALEPAVENDYSLHKRFDLPEAAAKSEAGLADRSLDLRDGARLEGRSQTAAGRGLAPTGEGMGGTGGMAAGLGMGPGMGGDRYEPIQENEFRRVSEEPLSTFSIDVDTASYSKVRQFVLNAGALPPAGAVRIEELVNYFDYGYQPPPADSEHPFASRVELASCPWKPEHRLARIAIKGKVIENESRPPSNLVFLVDTSGSMNEPNKLPLVKQGLQKLVGRLGEKDRVAIVVYAGSAGLVLDSTPASDRSAILRRINQMHSGGSTNGGEGIRLAYQVARDHFIKDGVNRVILCSDGDFNVGTTSDDELVTMVETESKGGIDLTVLGFGMGNHNDAMMEKISGRGNGNYAFIDSEAEAQRVLVEQTSSTLVTIARDVKIQVEFNPAEVAAYRLIGYENRRLANEDFKDDTKDAGEIGAGHSVTALYELIPASGDTAALAPAIDELRYQRPVSPTEASQSGEWMTVKLRYKKPDSDTSIPVSFPVTAGQQEFAAASADFRFAAAVASFGMLLRSSQHAGNWTLEDVRQAAEAAKGEDPHGLRTEFVQVVTRAAQLRVGEQ
ncbi:MAG: YfbK domain-containing protein [Planctomycetaceae bacterium]